MDKRPIILLVSDESREREALREQLQQEGYRVLTTATCEQALDQARQHAPAVALVDLWLADLPGHVVIHGLRQAAPETECIALMTNPAQQDGAVEALKLGAFSYIRRGLDYRQLLVTIRRALEKREAAHAIDDVKQRLAILFDAMPAGVLIVDDRTGAVVDANPAAVAFIGAPRAEIVGSLLQSRALAAKPVSAPLAAPVARPADTPGAPSAPVTPATGRRQTGRRIPATRTVATLLIGGRQHRLECFIDVTGRLEVEDRLAAEQVVLQMLLEGVPDLVMTVAPDGALLHLYRGGAPASVALASADAALLLPAGMRDRYRQTLHDVCQTGRSSGFSAGTPPFDSWSVRLDPITSHGAVHAVAVRARDLAGREREAQRLQFRDVATTHAPAALLIFNTDGLVVDANEAAAKLLDYSPGELIGLPFQRLDHPEQPQPWSRLWAAAAAHPKYPYTSRTMTQDGRLLPVQVTFYHTICTGTAMMLAFVDSIADREQTATVIANVAARENGLLNALNEAAWIVDRAGRVQNLNEAAARESKRPVERARGHAYDQLLPEPLARPRLRRVEDVFIRGAPVAFEDHDGTRRLAVQIAPIRDHEGTIILAAIVARDVTASRDQAQRLDLLRAVGPVGLIDLDLAPLHNWLATADSTWQRDPDAFIMEGSERLAAVLDRLRVEQVNTHAVRLLRLPDAAACRTGLAARVPEQSARTFAAVFLRLLATGPGAPAELEQTFTGGDGQPVYTHALVALMPDAAGQPRRAQLILTDRGSRQQALTDVVDISALERARLGRELRTALAEAPEPAREKLERLAQALERGAADDLGLMAALGRLGDDATARWGVTCRSNLRTAGLVNDRTLALHLQAIAGEAVDYAARLSGARQITITLSASPKEGVLTIKDDGHAATAGEPEDVTQRLIRVHAALIQGTLEIERDPRGGNIFTCRFPNG